MSPKKAAEDQSTSCNQICA